MKKVLLIITLLISALRLNAQSVTIDDLEFTVTSETPAECAVSGYSGKPVDITIPSTVTISGKEFAVTFIVVGAFYDCSSLTSIEIPSGVTSIGDYAFYDCSSLTSIEIPSGVTSIEYSTFYGCSSLTSIEFGENSQLTFIGDYAFQYCESLTSIELPSSVTSIGEGAFYDCSSLTSIEIPSGVTSIGEGAFYGCSSLTSIEIPSGVTSIGDWAFSGCSSLTSIEIPSCVTSIGDYAFRGCSSLTSIIVENGNTVYDSRDNCNAIIETATNTLIVGCQNTVIPNTVSFIGDSAFSGCSSLTSIEIPSGVTSIGDWAFSGCSSLTSIEIPSGVTSIGEGAFHDCSSLTSIEIPSGVTSIGEGAFFYCSSLTSIEIPSGVTSIGDLAFYDCSSLTSIYCYAETVPETSQYAFFGCPSNMVIYVPAQSVNDYNVTSPWKNYTIISLSCVVTASANPEDAGIITGAGEYTLNDTVTLTATPNEGYKFISWTENGEVVSNEAKYLFTATKDRDLIANFVQIGCNVVTLTSKPKGAGKLTGAGTYTENMNVTITATANKGYKFVNWMENDIIVSMDAEYSFTITSDRNIVANFKSTICVVSATANPEEAGTISGTGTYTEGMTITLTATANKGYKFLNWTEEDIIVSMDAEYSFEVTDNIDLIANFISTENVKELTSSYNIYPNPVSDKLYIETEVEIEEVVVYDVYGRRQSMVNGQQSMVNGQQSMVIDVTDLNSGVYFVKVVTSEGEVVKRFIKK